MCSITERPTDLLELLRKARADAEEAKQKALNGGGEHEFKVFEPTKCVAHVRRGRVGVFAPACLLGYPKGSAWALSYWHAYTYLDP